MLHPHELREGNWILSFDPREASANKKVFSQVTWRHIRAMEVEKKNNFEPISLTNELLARCNWTQKDGNQTFFHPKFQDYIVLQKTDKGYNTLLQQNATIGEAMNYLHQLQNRYYSLVFEELNVDMNNYKV